MVFALQSKAFVPSSKKRRNLSPVVSFFLGPSINFDLALLLDSVNCSRRLMLPSLD